MHVIASANGNPKKFTYFLLPLTLQDLCSSAFDICCVLNISKKHFGTKLIMYFGQYSSNEIFRNIKRFDGNEYNFKSIAFTNIFRISPRFQRLILKNLNNFNSSNENVRHPTLTAQPNSKQTICHNRYEVRLFLP